MSSLGGKTLAQAKINLFLKVLGKGIDGYHGIETLFLRLDLGDDVTLRVTDLGRAVDCEGLEGVAPEKNLAYRAAETFAAATGWPRGFSIEIRKRIPAGAGLGGGSADAAAVLRILNTISPDPLDDARLLDVARAVGSDVPFLTSGAAMALAWGRGERLLAVPPLTKKPVLIAVPEFGISTADAYARLDRGGALPTGAAYITVAALSSWGAVAALAQNDFEAVAGAEHPDIPRLISTFKLAGAQISRMTGTGSAVYAVFESAPLALPMMNSKVNLLTTLTSSSVVPVTVLD